MPAALTYFLYGVGVLFVVFFVVLLVLYTLARLYPSVGQVIADVLASHFLINWLVKGELSLKRGQEWGLSECRKNIARIEKTLTDDSSVVRIIASRLLWFILAALLILGEAFNIIAALPALSHFAYTDLPGWFVNGSIFLFILVPVTFWDILSEMAGHAFLNERLFPPINKAGRIVIASLAIIGLLITLWVTYRFFEFRAIYLDPVLHKSIAPQDMSEITTEIFVGLGIGLFLGLAIIRHAFIVGMELLWTAFIALFTLILAVLAFILSLIPRFVERMTLILSNGETSPYIAPLIKEAEDEPPTERKELNMDLQLFASVVFGGSFGSEAYDPLTSRMTQDVVLTTTLLDLDGNQALKPIPNGITNIAPSLAAQHLYGNLSPEERYKKLFNEIGKNQVEEHFRYRGAGATFLYVLDCHVISYAEQMLTEVHNQLPHHYLVVVTSVSKRDLRNKVVLDNLHLLEELYESGVLSSSIIIDPASPFALDEKHGEQVQLAFAAHALMGFLAAHTHTGNGWTNKTAKHVLSKLPVDCPYLSLSFASINIVSGDPPRKLGWLSWFIPQSKKKKVAGGDPGHAVMQAKYITDQVVTEKSKTRALAVPIDQNDPAILLCHTAFPIGPKFAHFSVDYRRQFESGYYHYLVMTLAKGGMWYIEEAEPNWILQVTCFYPFRAAALAQWQPQAQMIAAKNPLSIPQDTTHPELPAKETDDTVAKETSPSLSPLPVAEGTIKKNTVNGDGKNLTKRDRQSQETKD